MGSILILLLVRKRRREKEKMLSRTLTNTSRRLFRTSAFRAAEEAGADAAAATKVNLTLATPSGAVYENTPVDLVSVPGMEGEFGITAGHTPIISQMKPGVITVHHERDTTVEKFFTAGGFTFTHENSTTDVACVELVKVEDIDEAAASAGIEQYKAEMEAAQEGTEAHVNAQIAYETHLAMANAVGASN